MIYIQTGDIILEMSVTTDIEIIYNSDVTQHKLEQGFSIADHIVNRNKKFTIKGLVTDVKVIRILEEDQTEVFERDTVVTFFEDIEALRANKDLVTFYFDPRLNQSSGISNCVLKNVRFSSNVEHGGAYTVNMEVEQVRVTESATVTEVKRQENPDQTEDEAKGSDQSTVQSPVGSILGDVFGVVEPPEEPNG